MRPNSVKVHVVLVDGLGESHRYSHHLCGDGNLGAFLEDMDKSFSKYCDPYNEWAHKNWDARIQDLRKTGMNRDPTLDRIDGLIALHKATKGKELPQWMYYTVHSKGVKGEETYIQDDESFKTMLSRAANKESPGCLMRVSLPISHQKCTTEDRLS